MRACGDFIPRFLLQQRLRDRLIDNAKTGKQNRFTQCPETIFSITLDWLGIALKCLEAVFVERCSECNEHSFPEWYDPGISLDDLPDAFKGCPVHPADQRACIVAVWSELSGKWLFAKSYSCLFGIGSVVVSFNRLPALATAVSKRLGLCMCAAYFDDLITLESLNFRASARPFLLLVLTALGAPTIASEIIPVRSAPCMARSRAQFGDAQRRFVLLPPAKRIFCHTSGPRVLCGNRARFAHTCRSSHSPRTGGLDSNVVSWTFWADRNALSQNEAISVASQKAPLWM